MVEKLSLCCEVRLKKYNEAWEDGICSGCDEHSGALGGRHDPLADKSITEINEECLDDRFKLNA